MKLSRVIIFFFAVVILFVFIIPPFQNPDEPHHFGAALIESLGEGKRDYIEKEIIRMMDQNAWWRFVGIGRPEVLPDELTEIPYLMGYYPATDFRSRLNNITFYHFLLGMALKLLGIKDISSAYHFFRFISALLIASSLCLIYLTFKRTNRILGRRGDTWLLWGGLFILLIPQFFILAASVNSDAPSLFLSSLFFYLFFFLITKEFKTFHLLWLPTILLIAVVGFLTDRSIFSLIFLAMLLPFFLFKKKNYQDYVVLLLGFVILFMLISTWLVSIFPLQVENSAKIVKSIWERSISGIPQLFSLGDFNRQFFLILVDSFLLKFGWMAFSAGKAFYFIWRAGVVVSVLGVIIFCGKFLFSRVFRHLPRFGGSTELRLVLFSLAAIFVQIFGIWGYYGLSEIMPQGRYLFPVIVPIAFLFILGLKTFFDVFHKRAGGIAVSVFVVLEFLFLNYVIWNYVVPVFYLTVKSPHPGI